MNTVDKISIKDLESLKTLVNASFNLSNHLMEFRGNRNQLARMPNQLQPLVARQLLVSLMQTALTLKELGMLATSQALETDNNQLIIDYDLDDIASVLKGLAMTLDNSNHIS